MHSIKIERYNSGRIFVHNELEDGEDCEELVSLLMTYVLPFILVFGLFGNLLASLIFLSTNLKKRSSSVYLAALSAADFGFLVTLIPTHLEYLYDISIVGQDVICKVALYFSCVFSSSSIWLIVAFTIERYIAVKYPLKRPQMCTVVRAKLITVSIFGIAFLFPIYVFWAGGLIKNKDDLICDMLPEYKPIMIIINYLDTMITLILPLMVIVVLNCMITRSLILFHETLFMNESDRTHTSLTTCSDDGVRINLSILKSHQGSSSGETSQKIAHYGRKLLIARSQQNVTKLLLIISTVYILLNVPSYVLRFYIFTKSVYLPETRVWCVQQFTMTLYYANYSVNFLLYSMCGTAFRKILLIYIKSKYQWFKSLCVK